ncbi:hypothetical protein [Amycolatopsis saalfeldensis]|uniref:Lipoprotein n=1 Tax=Amycolatopsis saalfeldensis TaxID=394193 RepID=A0A1H8YBV1_9PSEU|nr:hypothetical protein [Amycolatopsis saalfeldensis]SEP49730.1 hypothetical protein SAMN04489732_113183 [Amycolatopsis saalfeldensis]
MNKRRFGAAMAVTVTAVLLSACGGQQPSEPRQTTVSAADENTLDLAEQLLIRDCMGKAGFEYFVVPENAVPDNKEFPYVLTDVAWARKHGYGNDVQHQLRAADRNRSYFATLPAARQQAANVAEYGASPTGVTAKMPDGPVYTHSQQGCQASAERTLYGDLQSWFQAKMFALDLTEMKVDKVKADSRYTAATAAWATCMKAAGHPFDNPDKLRVSLPDTDEMKPAASEVQLAVTEATCANSTVLATVAATLDAEYTTRLDQTYASDVDKHRWLQLSALPAARTMVAAAHLPA